VSTTAGESPRITIEDRSGERGRQRDLEDLRRGLSQRPLSISSRFFYDDRGSALFERITTLPEYYQTRTEAALLERIGPEVAARTRARTLVELGSGAATKTRHLLGPLRAAGTLELYVPFDVAEGTLRRVAEELVAAYPGLAVHGVVGDFLGRLAPVPGETTRLVIFLGGTIGNLLPDERAAFLARLAAAMAPGDHFLLGVDLVKPVERVEAAYNDAQGVTAEFNRNILRVVNELTGGDFAPEAFGHRAFYDPEKDWIEARLVARGPQTVRLPALDRTLEIAPGEEIHTEISAKFDRPRTEAMLRGAGLEPLAWWTDEEELFGLALARR
jgi:L-histidine Nalpha-methyltransferase